MEKKRFEIIHTLTINITGIFTGCNNKSEITGAGQEEESANCAT